MNCQKCNFQNKGNAKFCTHCGAKLTPSSKHKNSWWWAGGMAVAALAIALVYVFSIKNDKTFYFEGEYPQPELVGISENGTEYRIEAIPGHVILYFQNGTSSSQAEKIIKQNGGKIIEQMPEYDYYLAEVKKGRESDFIVQMRENSEVEYAFLNTVQYPQSSQTYLLDVFKYDEKHKASHGEEVKKTFLRTCSPNRLLPVYDRESCITNLHGRYVGSTINTVTKNLINIMKNANKNELTLINISMAPSVNDEKGNVEDENGKKLKYSIVGKTQQKNYIKDYFNYLTYLAMTIERIEHTGKTNFIITNGSGNNGIPNLDELVLSGLDAQTNAILKRHLILVSAYDTKDFYYSNNLRNKCAFAATVNISEEPLSGTSFAAPKMLGYIDRMINICPDLTVFDILQAIRTATPKENPREPISYKKLECEANKMCGIPCDWDEFVYTFSDNDGIINLPDGQQINYSCRNQEFFEMSRVYVNLSNTANYAVHIKWQAIEATNLKNLQGEIRIAGGGSTVIEFPIIEMGMFHLKTLQLRITKQ